VVDAECDCVSYVQGHNLICVLEVKRGQRVSHSERTADRRVRRRHFVYQGNFNGMRKKGSAVFLVPKRIRSLFGPGHVTSRSPLDPGGHVLLQGSVPSSSILPQELVASPESYIFPFGIQNDLRNFDQYGRDFSGALLASSLSYPYTQRSGATSSCSRLGWLGPAGALPFLSGPPAPLRGTGVSGSCKAPQIKYTTQVSTYLDPWHNHPQCRGQSETQHASQWPRHSAALSSVQAAGGC